MSGWVVLTALSLTVRAVATAWPVLAYRRLGERGLLVLSLAGLLLLVEELGTLGPEDAGLSLAVSVGALAVVAVAVEVVGRRMAAYRALRESEELNRVALSHVSDAVFITDDDGVLTHVWPGCADFFGHPRDSVEPGTRVEALLGRRPVDPEALERDGEVTNLPIDVTRPGGAARRLLVSVTKVAIERGTALYSCRDVTKITETEAALERALAEVEALKDRYEAEAHYLQDEIRADHNVMGIVGSSPRLEKMLEAVRTVADTESTVLIRGETGAGKELVARALHELSSRTDRPLVKVNCAALPATLIESELFGHEKGAFTGALERGLGRFELAHRGTLFLDEVGELPLELQPKLLRVLQEGEFERVGGSETLRVDVRLLAATNRDLRREVEEGRFRSDLYYRLEVFPIVVPPLRERAEDIPVLAAHFLREIGASLGRPLEGFTRRSMEAMLAYRWPGNVRELRNVVERAAIVSVGGSVDLTPYLDGPSTLDPAGPGAAPASRRLEDVERSHIARVLDEVGWKVEGEGGAAEVLDLHPSTLRARLRKLGLRRPRA